TGSPRWGWHRFAQCRTKGSQHWFAKSSFAPARTCEPIAGKDSYPTEKRELSIQVEESFGGPVVHEVIGRRNVRLARSNAAAYDRNFPKQLHEHAPHLGRIFDRNVFLADFFRHDAPDFHDRDRKKQKVARARTEIYANPVLRTIAPVKVGLFPTI